MNDENPGFTIKIVSERTGVSVHTLRAWERRYGLPNPIRSAQNRYRLYAEQDIADVLWLKRQIEAGLSPALATAMRRQQQSPPIAGAPTDNALPLRAMRSALENALAVSDAAAARQILDEMFGMFSPEQLALQIIEPTMRGLGLRWQRNELGVWQEHLASNLVRQRLLSFIQAQPEPAHSASSLVAACAPEEQHELGLLLLALLARRQGWQVAYLGQRTPLGELLPLAGPNRWIAISVSTAFGLASLLPLFEGQSWARNRLLIGGYLPNQLPHLQEHLPGVFLGTNAQEAVRALTTGEPAPNKWTPGAKALRAGLSLQRDRLRIGWQTIDDLTPMRTRGSPQSGWTRAQILTMPTLFLIDALSGALAFEVPELVKAQDFWLTQVTPPHGVATEPIKRYLASFTRAVKKNLDVETARQVIMMLEQLRLDSTSTPAFHEHSSS